MRPITREEIKEQQAHTTDGSDIDLLCDTALSYLDRAEAAERERDEAIERCDALEDAVRENLSEVTGDADGNLESNEVVRIEIIGLLYRELEKRADRAEARLAELAATLGWLWRRLGSPDDQEFDRVRTALASSGSLASDVLRAAEAWREACSILDDGRHREDAEIELRIAIDRWRAATERGGKETT